MRFFIPPDVVVINMDVPLCTRNRTPHLKTFGPMTLREIEMQVIHQALERLGGNKPKAAEELGISLKTLYNKLNQSSGGLERSA